MMKISAIDLRASSSRLGSVDGASLALIKRSREASRDFKLRDQLAGAASDISGCQAEGFARYRPAEIANFLTYALASLAEAEDRLEDGILRG
jgi:four helix bundle protein